LRWCGRLIIGSTLLARAVRSERFIVWLPAVVLPPVLILGAALDGRSVTAPVVLAAFLGVAPVLARRRVAFGALMVPFVAGVFLEAAFVRPGFVVLVLPMVMLYDLARYGHRRRSLWMAVMTIPSILICTIPFLHGAQLIRGIMQSLVVCALVIAAADLVRTRRLAAQRALDAREAQTMERLADQRLAIAHEIHDTIAHAMTAIKVQAGVAAHLIDRDPAQARTALQAIEDTSGEAIAELRGTLHVLRDPAGGAPMTPTAALSDLDLLTDGLRRAGLSVALDATPVSDLPAAIQAAGYRILQEATTNVIRHAHADTVSIQLRRDAAGLEIEVTDDGTGSSDHSAPGNGMRGMRERAAALGGEVTATPARPHGWRVHARLPIPGAGLT
jgi:signal transduction histidine kinase